MLARVSRLQLKRNASRPSHLILIRLWSSKDVRSKFIKFFEDENHHHFPSSSVVPKKGGGTYFTNAGMNQFKPLFLDQCDNASKLWGLERAVNSQKCIRVGGKHNDLEDVGHDLTHHTFFEMLGSWSFGDYFKKEACSMAFELLLNQYSLPMDRLYFTYFGGDDSTGLSVDEECRDIWASLGVPQDRILPYGAKDNFWDMGVTGPCGPCTEIHYDHVGKGFAGSKVNAGSPDVVEIWNLVFMQYARQVDQTLTLLPSRHVDTGMGLERMVAVLNGTADNYSTDLFTPLFQRIHQASKSRPYQGQLTREDTAYRILADHCRMLTVAISDGLLPSNENLGHKVRIILHKCIQLCRQHFHCDPDLLLPDLVKAVVVSLGETYPELIPNQGKVIDVVKLAIVHHDKSMQKASRSFQKMMSKTGPSKILSGEVMSLLETGHFGQAMPIETVVELAHSHGLEVDLKGYQQQQQQQQQQQLHEQQHTTEEARRPMTRAPPSRPPIQELIGSLTAQAVPATQDVYKYLFSTHDGKYDFAAMGTQTAPCRVQGMLGYEGQTTLALQEGEHGQIILDKTCFYAEAGGQEADTGCLRSSTGIFRVEDVQSHRGYVVHSGHMTAGCLTVGQDMFPEISQACRRGNMRNHTATHLLNAALSSVLATTQQQGSNVTSHRFTFDFLALSKFDIEELEIVESKVKDMIGEGHLVTCREMSLTEAMTDSSIRRIEHEEYPESVRLVSVGTVEDGAAVSHELCGGTHVLNTAHIDAFCVTGLNAKSQHVKRVTCVTGPQAKQACDTGQVVELMCSFLHQLCGCVEGSTSVDTVAHLGQTLCARAQQVKEFLQEQLENSTEDFDRTWEEAEKTINLMNSVCQDILPIQPTLSSKADAVSVMKQLVGRLYQSQRLELLPKTVRHSAQTCLHGVEHRVQAAVNAEKTAAIRQALEQTTPGEDNSVPHFVTVDADINLRQVVKVVTQTSLARPSVVVQNAPPHWNLVVGLPGGSEKPDLHLDSLLKVLNSVGAARGKVAAHKKSQSVWRVSLKGGNQLSQERLETELLNWWKEKR